MRGRLTSASGAAELAFGILHEEEKTCDLSEFTPEISRPFLHQEGGKRSKSKYLRRHGTSSRDVRSCAALTPALDTSGQEIRAIFLVKYRQKCRSARRSPLLHALRRIAFRSWSLYPVDPSE